MKLAVIGTFYQRHRNTLSLFRRVLEESTRAPDEFWVMCEGEDDVSYATQAAATIGASSSVHIQHLPTPRTPENKYAIIPYSNKINWALDHSNADVIVYLDNNSMPSPNKYKIMLGAMEEYHWKAVYCSQQRTGFKNEIFDNNSMISDAFLVLNYTQVMHQKTKDRWTLDMEWALPYDLADGLFWRSLHASLGPFFPCTDIGGEILDIHHIDSPKAVGLE